MAGHPHADLMAKAAEIGIPEPVLELPECGDTLWIADITYAEAVHITWHESKTNLLLFSLGMLHTTKESAEAHIAALLSFTQK